MTEQEDLFGEKHIQIKGDSYLNKIAQHIYDLVSRDKTLLDGESMNQIYRQIQFAVMLDSGLIKAFKTSDIDTFKAWFLSRDCATEEEIARATRGLVSSDYIRLSKNLILKNEQFKQRIAQSIKR